MDQNRVCTEYWKSRPLMQFPQNPQSEENSGNLIPRTPISNNGEASKSHTFPAGVDTLLSGLFKKSNPEELHALYNILSNSGPTADRGLVSWLLNEEIHKRPR